MLMAGKVTLRGGSETNTGHTHTPCAAVKLPRSCTIPYTYNNSYRAPFVWIVSSLGFRSLGEEHFGVRATGSKPRFKHRTLALANEFFRGEACVTTLCCKFFCSLADQQRVRRVQHDIASNTAGMQKIADGGDGTNLQLSTVHDACVHFNFSTLVQKASTSLVDSRLVKAIATAGKMGGQG